MDLTQIPGGYFEGILQLRHPTKELMQFVESHASREGNTMITKKLKVPNGHDYYFASQKFMRSLGEKIKRVFPGELKTSRRIFTRSHVTSKDVYRVNVLFRMYDVHKGQVILYKGNDVKIINLGRKIFAKEVKTGKKVSFNYDEISVH